MAQANMQVVKTTRFGEFEAPDDKIITMTKPVLGFEGHERFVLVDREDTEPFVWLQSLTDPELAFLMINPVLFFKDYEIEVHRKEVEDIEANETSPLETFVIITTSDNVQKLTANLQGPIVLNPDTKKAKQLVLANAGYSVAQPLFAENVSEGEPTTRNTVNAQ